MQTGPVITRRPGRSRLCLALSSYVTARAVYKMCTPQVAPSNSWGQGCHSCIAKRSGAAGNVADCVKLSQL